MSKLSGCESFSVPSDIGFGDDSTGMLYHLEY